MSASASAGPIIKVEGVSKWFSKFQVLKDIDLSVDIGERIVVCGPSGSGKSTLIRCINQLEHYDQGRIIVDGIELGRHAKAARHWCAARSAWCSSSSTCFRI